MMTTIHIKTTMTAKFTNGQCIVGFNLVSKYFHIIVTSWVVPNHKKCPSIPGSDYSFSVVPGFAIPEVPSFSSNGRVRTMDSEIVEGR